MLKRMSVLFCGLAVVLMTAGVANAQTATEKTKTAAKKTGEAVEKGAKKTAEVVTDAEITTAVKTKFLADSKVSGLKIDVDTDKHVATLTALWPELTCPANSWICFGLVPTQSIFVGFSINLGISVSRKARRAHGFVVSRRRVSVAAAALRRERRHLVRREPRHHLVAH